MVPIILASDKTALRERLMNRSQLTDEAVSQRVKEIVANVRENGDKALLDYTARFDKASMTPEKLRVTQAEIDAAYKQADEKWIKAMREAAKRITAFHEKQKQKTWLDIEEGMQLGQLIRPLQSVGVYVPGGTAAYPSSVPSQGSRCQKDCHGDTAGTGWFGFVSFDVGCREYCRRG